VKRSYGLDRFGMQVYEACDGKTSVHRIVKRFAVDNGLGPAERRNWRSAGSSRPSWPKA